jgi:hypothetical protein
VLPVADAAIRRERARQAQSIGAAKARLRAPSKAPLTVLREELNKVTAGETEEEDEPSESGGETGTGGDAES